MESTMNEIDMASAAKVAGHVNLEAVKLLRCDCRQRPQYPDGLKAFDIKRTSQFELSDGRDSIGVAIRFVLTAFGKDEPQKEESAFLTIEAEFFLLYSIQKAADLDDVSFKSFAEFNGTYNAWPYWREFVQSVTSRMELPPLTIPVFRLPCGSSKASSNPEALPEAIAQE
jgi:hypothetical protein